MRSGIYLDFLKDFSRKAQRQDLSLVRPHRLFPPGQADTFLKQCNAASEPGLFGIRKKKLVRSNWKKVFVFSFFVLSFFGKTKKCTCTVKKVVQFEGITVFSFWEHVSIFGGLYYRKLFPSFSGELFSGKEKILS